MAGGMRYVSGGFVAGIPARDLDGEEVIRLAGSAGLSVREFMAGLERSGAYVRLEEGKRDRMMRGGSRRELQDEERKE